MKHEASWPQRPAESTSSDAAHQQRSRQRSNVFFHIVICSLTADVILSGENKIHSDAVLNPVLSHHVSIFTGRFIKVPTYPVLC